MHIVMRLRRAITCIGVLALTGLPAHAGLVDGVRAMPDFSGEVPNRTDIVFSSRFTRPEALPVIRAFGATRVEWVYTDNAAFTTSLRAQVPWFGGTLNANGPLPDDAGYARDFDGKLLAAPWMKTWGVNWITTTHPSTREAMRRKLELYLSMGAKSIQYDDPTLQLFAALYQAGDFNETTQEGFRTWLSQRVDPKALRAAGLHTLQGSYRDWLVKEHGIADAQAYQRVFRQLPSTPLWLAYIRWTVSDYFIWLKAEAARIAGRKVPLSMNLSDLFEPADVNPTFFQAPLADYAMSETQTADRARMVSQWAVARSLGLGSVPSIRPRNRADDRVAIAHLYALGAQPIVPWDVYDGNDEQGRAHRFFGTPDDFSDLYTFVRQHPALHDGLEVSPLIGVLVPVDRNQHQQVRAFVKRLDERQLPYRYVLADGEAAHVPDPARLRHLQVVYAVGNVNQMSAVVRTALADPRMPPVRSADAVSDNELEQLRPVILAPDQAKVRVVPRANPSRADRLFLHLIDETRGAEPDTDNLCQRRVGIRRTALDGRDILDARVAHLGETKRRTLVITRNPEFIYLTLPGCALWSVLELDLR